MLDGHLSALCGQFEAAMLREILTSAGLGRRISFNTDTDAGAVEHFDDGSQALFVEALAGAIVRAGGVGIGRALTSALHPAG